jgi:hypothetical protein
MMCTVSSHSQFAQNKGVMGKFVIHISYLKLFNRCWRNLGLMVYVVRWIWVSYRSSIIPALHEPEIESCVFYKTAHHTKYWYVTLMPLRSLNCIWNTFWCGGIASEIQQTVFSDNMLCRRPRRCRHRGHRHQHGLGPLIACFSSKYGYFNFQLNRKIPYIYVATEILL